MTTQTPNKPIQTIRDGSVSLKLWEQSYGDNQRFVTASVEKSFKRDDGSWGTSKSFGEKDLLKLQSILPEARREMQQWHEFYRESDRAQQQPQQEPIRDMAAERDAALQAARESRTNHTPEHAPERGQGQELAAPKRER